MIQQSDTDTCWFHPCRPIQQGTASTECQNSIHLSCHSMEGEEVARNIRVPVGTTEHHFLFFWVLDMQDQGEQLIDHRGVRNHDAARRG